MILSSLELGIGATAKSLTASLLLKNLPSQKLDLIEVSQRRRPRLSPKGSFNQAFARWGFLPASSPPTSLSTFSSVFTIPTPKGLSRPYKEYLAPNHQCFNTAEKKRKEEKEIRSQNKSAA